MTAKEWFEKHITEENCNWSEFEQCHNHKFTITYMMKQYAQEMCRQQREICADNAMVDGGCDWNHGDCTIDKDSILNAPEPKMD
jgi:hypothetical protein